jgi:hypothetical protein
MAWQAGRALERSGKLPAVDATGRIPDMTATLNRDATSLD